MIVEGKCYDRGVAYLAVLVYKPQPIIVDTGGRLCISEMIANGGGAGGIRVDPAQISESDTVRTSLNIVI